MRSFITLILDVDNCLEDESLMFIYRTCLLSCSRHALRGCHPSTVFSIRVAAVVTSESMRKIDGARMVEVGQLIRRTDS